MIRTVIVPQNQNISIVLPQQFVGKQVEIIAFSIEEFQAGINTNDLTLTHFASREALSKDWLTLE